MLKPKEVQDLFLSAPWTSSEQVAAFADETCALGPADVQRLLATLLDRTLAADSHKQRLRCAAFGMIAMANLSQELFTPFARALRAADAQTRAVLVQILPRVNQIAKHGELCQVLGATDVEVRKAAAEALRPIIGPSGFDALHGLVAEPSFAGRMEAMDVVAAKAAHHAIPLFATVLQRGTTAERVRALDLLADTRLMSKDLAGARRVIATSFDDSDRTVVSRAIVALSAVCTEQEFWEALGPRLDTVNLVQLTALVSALRRYSSPKVVEFLTRKFREGPNAIRLAVVDAVESMATDDVLPILLEALGGHRLAVRLRAAEVLSNLGAAGKLDVARAIIWLLRSRDPNVRRIAVEVVKKVGDPTGDLTPKLFRFLRDEDWWVRERVMDALVELSGATLTRHLATLLQDPSDVVRRFAIGGLSRLRDPRSIGALVRAAMDDADWWVREEAVLALGHLGDAKAVPYIFEVLKRYPTERLVCVQAFGNLGAAIDAARLAELLGDEDADVRLAVVQCLTKLDARETATLVASREVDPDFRVRVAVTELLATWRVVRAVVEKSSDQTLSLLDQLLVDMAKMGADDLIVIPGRPPSVKLLSKILPLGSAALSPEQTRTMLFSHLTPMQVANLAKMTDVDFSYEVKGHGLRFRGHVFAERRGFGAVFRFVKNEVPQIEKLGLPPIIETLASLKNGLVLVGGPTGSGKSTTLAALIDYINRSAGHHIVTVEDPIEVVHQNRKSLISQREVGTHTPSFANALRGILRQDPDVILVGEMRDLATIGFAVSAAETGHLVFGTVHTVSAESSVDRLVNAFPAGQQPQVRSMLADTLRAVICQHLLKVQNGPGRVLAVEVMVNNDAVAGMLRKGKTFQIPSVVQSSREQGMQSMDSELIRLVKAGTVSREDAYMKAIDKKVFEGAFGGEAAKGGPPPSVVRPQQKPTGSYEV